MSWKLEIRRAGCVYSGSNRPGIYEIPVCTEKEIHQINVVGGYGKEWNRWGWLIAFNIPSNWNDPGKGRVWSIYPAPFEHYMGEKYLLHAEKDGDYFAVIALFTPVRVPIGYPPIMFYEPPKIPEKDYILLRSLRLDQASSCKHYLYLDDDLIDAVEKEDDILYHSYAYEYVIDLTKLSRAYHTLKYTNTSEAVEEGGRGQWLVEIIRDGSLMGVYLVDKSHPMEFIFSPEPLPSIAKVELFANKVGTYKDYTIWKFTTRVVLSARTPQNLVFEYSLRIYLGHGYWKEVYRGSISIRQGNYYGEHSHNIAYKGSPSNWKSTVKGIDSNVITVPPGKEYEPPPSPPPEIPIPPPPPAPPIPPITPPPMPTIPPEEKEGLKRAGLLIAAESLGTILIDRWARIISKVAKK